IPRDEQTPSQRVGHESRASRELESSSRHCHTLSGTVRRLEEQIRKVVQGHHVLWLLRQNRPIGLYSSISIVAVFERLGPCQQAGHVRGVRGYEFVEHFDCRGSPVL